MDSFAGGLLLLGALAAIACAQDGYKVEGYSAGIGMCLIVGWIGLGFIAGTIMGVVMFLILLGGIKFILKFDKGGYRR